MLEASCSYATRQSQAASELMTSFRVSPTSSLQVATAALTGNAPSPSNQASFQLPALSLSLTDQQVLYSTQLCLKYISMYRKI